MTSMSSTRAFKYSAAAGAVVLAAVAAAVIWSATAEPDLSDWGGRVEFCEAASHLQVGAEELPPEEFEAVFVTLHEEAPDEMEEEFATLLHSTQSGEVLDEDFLNETGRFVEEQCEVDLTGVK